MDTLRRRPLVVTVDRWTAARMLIGVECTDPSAFLDRAAAQGLGIAVGAARSDLSRVVRAAHEVGLPVAVVVDPSIPVDIAQRVADMIEAIVLVSPPRTLSPLTHGTLDKMLTARRFLDAGGCDVALGLLGASPLNAALVIEAGADLLISAGADLVGVRQAVEDELSLQRMLRPALAR